MSTNASDREKRRAEALRANLKRRKAAARSRTTTDASLPPDAVQGPSQFRPNKAQKPE